VTRSQGSTDKLDDVDYPAYTVGLAADLLGTQPDFLCSLDAAGWGCCVVRSQGRHPMGFSCQAAVC
jgi:hypothetical protein